MSLLHFIIIIKSIIFIIAPPSPQPSPAEEFIHDNLASLYRINNVLGLLISDNSKDALQACSNFLIYGREDDNYQNILLYTGHDFSYLGSPVDCGKSKNNYTYNILSFTRNLDETSDNYQKQLDVFLDLKQVIVGLCMWDDCVPEVEAIAQEEPDSKFYKTLTTYYGITKITNYNIVHKINLNDYSSFESLNSFMDCITGSAVTFGNVTSRASPNASNCLFSFLIAFLLDFIISHVQCFLCEQRR